MDFKELAQGIAALGKELYRSRPGFYDAYDSMECAVKKYGVTVDGLIDGTAGDLDYKKLIWQILIDLRFARGTDYDFDIELYRKDTVFLEEITRFLEQRTAEFCTPGSRLISIGCLDLKEYQQRIKELGLK